MTASRSDPVRKRDDVDEPRALVLSVVGARKVEAAHIGEELRVARGNVGPRAKDVVELLELADADRGPDVVDPVVESEPCMLEPAAGVGAALVAQASQQPPLRLRMRRDHAALAGRDLLVRVEGKDRRGPL